MTNVRHRLDVTNGNTMAARILEINDVGRVEIATARPVALEAYTDSRETGGFILVDRMTGETLAAGLTCFACDGPPTWFRTTSRWIGRRGRSSTVTRRRFCG